MIRLAPCVIHLLLGALLFAAPSLSRRELLFAVPIAAGFRESRAARHAIRMYRSAVAAAILAGLCALLVAPLTLLAAIVPAALLLVLLVSGVSFYGQHRKLSFAAVQFERPREAELTGQPDRLPWFTWLAGGPFLLLAGAALWLTSNWDRIPERFPVHFNFAGQADRWAERTPRGVYGILLFGFELCAWMLVMALATWFGARRSQTRTGVLGGLIGVQYSLALIFAMISLRVLLGIPLAAAVLMPLLLLLPNLIWMSRMMKPSGPPDPTPNECWKAGILYYNPGDAALFVEKREGLGYTFNFANRWSWALLFGLLLVLVSGPLVLA